MRDDALNGSHWDFYFYEAASGQLQSVLDVWSGEVNEFVWNPEGMLISLRTGNSLLYYDYNETGQLKSVIYLDDNTLPSQIVAYEYNSDGQLIYIRDSENGREFRLGCGIACSHAYRTYGRYIGLEQWKTISISLQNDGKLISLHRILEEGDVAVGEILWVHYGAFNIAALTDQSGAVVTRSGEQGHCDRLKEKLLDLLPSSACKTRFGILPCSLPPDDCRRFNDLLYRFCYECKDNPTFALECSRFAEWYYKYSGCKNNAPYPRSPFLPPPIPGYPVAPLPSPPSVPIPSPCRGDRCNIPEITSPSSPPREPCPIHNPEAYFICKWGITDNPTSCARIFNGFRQGALGNEMCLGCCEIAARYYGWDVGRLTDCRNACMVLNP